MICFAGLGNYGRLGNQMFQVAATLSVANHRGTYACFPKNCQIQDVFELKDCKFVDSANPHFIFNESSFEFDKNVFSVPNMTNIHGYFQSEKYFENCEFQILENFKFKKSIADKAELNLKRYNQKLCAIHIRRGDYLKFSDVHQFPGLDYYEKSINKIKEKFNNVSFLIFSDDIEWCKSVDLFKDCDFVENETDSVEMCMITKCDFHIIANSSFSWWGARLSNSKLTVAPSRWFGENGPKSWKDIYCKNWEII